jgi:hypothetical protein
MRTRFYSLAVSPVVFLLLAACGGGSGSGSGGDASPCMAGEVTQELVVEEFPSSSGPQLAPWSLLSILDGADGPSLLLQRSAANESRTISFLGPDGKLLDLAQVTVGKASFGAAPVVMSKGRRCAAYVVDQKTLHLACEGLSTEDSTLTVEANNNGLPLLATYANDDTLSVFSTARGAFTPVNRTKEGVWEGVNQFETAVSWTADAALHNGLPVACYISSSGHAVFISKTDRVTSTEKAKSCRFAGDDTTAYVLLDSGYTKILWAQVKQGRQTAFEVRPVPIPGRVLTIAVNGGQPFAVTIDPATKKIQRVALESGKVTDLGDVKDPDRTYVAEHNVSTQTLVVASLPSVDTTSGGVVKQSFRIATYCTASW